MLLIACFSGSVPNETDDCTVYFFEDKQFVLRVINTKLKGSDTGGIAKIYYISLYQIY